MGQRNPKMSYTLRILAGAYLCYIAFTLAKGFLKGEGETMPLAVTVIAVVAFAVIGVLFLVTGLKGMKVLKEQPPEEVYEEEDEDESDMETIEGESSAVIEENSIPDSSVEVSESGKSQTDEKE